jgi:hypothetical protein
MGGVRALLLALLVCAAAAIAAYGAMVTRPIAPPGPAAPAASTVNPVSLASCRSAAGCLVDSAHALASTLNALESSAEALPNAAPNGVTTPPAAGTFSSAAMELKSELTVYQYAAAAYQGQLAVWGRGTSLATLQKGISTGTNLSQPVTLLDGAAKLLAKAKSLHLAWSTAVTNAAVSMTVSFENTLQVFARVTAAFGALAAQPSAFSPRGSSPAAVTCGPPGAARVLPLAAAATAVGSAVWALQTEMDGLASARPGAMSRAFPGDYSPAAGGSRATAPRAW